MAKNFKDLYQNMSLESQHRAEAKANKMMEEMLLLKTDPAQKTSESILAVPVAAKATLFGAMANSVKLERDIVSPLDNDWEKKSGK